MGFSDLSTEAGLKQLNEFLADKSFIEGHEASQADAVVYKAVGSAPDAAKYQHAARWYKQIATEDLAALPGTAKELSAYGPAAAAAEAADEDDIDLFGSDDEVDEEAERVKAERIAEYNKRKAAKPKPAAKSLVTLEIKPWDDETPMDELEKAVRAIEMDGLLWGSAKLVPIGFGVSKLQMSVVVEDDKVSIDELQETIEEIEDYVQSTDVAAMAKL
ncbi:translation elongation factor EF-1 beta subunit [Schizosaccharomyces japonicus yFS275]|uniref:Translation elongation factor EF-1 beta subunit n=1 Tax=Schizosaccharomyces japonicus (strain yFS275 / FY16936) TaxID=402676 RepID=B6K2M6_SCHJY|nr:translation elongation factor EF-1 beta subunit [Schizosaccharomyces japonicus yFS275]EEB07407.1 translation elongation factor EF-1 beta subunit [Schizosaccharomyces japonicus yFS275]